MHKSGEREREAWNCVGNGGNTITFHVHETTPRSVVYKRGEVAPDSFQYSRENRKTYCWTRKGVVANRVERRYVFIRIREGNSIRKTRAGIRLLLEQRLSCFIFFFLYLPSIRVIRAGFELRNEIKFEITFDARKRNVYHRNKDTIMYYLFFGN